MIKNWDEIKDIGWDNLLLGNGFSTNVWSKYSYRSLYEYSLENKIEPVLCSKVQLFFEELQTINFEEVLKALAWLNGKKSVGEELDEYLTLYKTVQDNLFNTVHAVHVNYSAVKNLKLLKRLKASKKYSQHAMTNFIGRHSEFYLQILLLIFSGALTLHLILKIQIFMATNQDFYYLHGALHLQQDLKGKVSKLSYTSASLPSKEEFSYQGNNTKSAVIYFRR